MMMPISSQVSLSREIILRVSSSSGLTIPDRETVRGRRVYFGGIDMSIAGPYTEVFHSSLVGRHTLSFTPAFEEGSIRFEVSRQKQLSYNEMVVE